MSGTLHFGYRTHRPLVRGELALHDPLHIYARARLGAFVFHDSLLPEYRGFAPTVWAIVNGRDHTGATLCHMADEVDSGDIVDQERIP